MEHRRIIPLVSSTTAAGRGDGAPSASSGAPQDPARRILLKWMAASTALAAAGCSGPPEEPIVPYAHMPEGGPGDEPVFYASAVTRGGCAQPVLVETHTGRPTKIEGNPRHPMSGGATDAQAQAAILQLWDPDRSRTPQRGDATSSWQAATEALLARLPAMDKDGGAGLRILTPNVTSPTLLRQLDALAARYPGMRWHRHDPLHDAAAEEGARRALGMAARPLYRLDRTRVILAVGADLFMDTPASVRYGRDFSRGRGDATDAGARAGGPRHAESSRHARSGNGDDGGAAAPPGAARSASSPAAARARLYALESMPGLTGAMADQRWAMTPDAMGMLLRRLAAALGVPGADAPAGPGAAWEARLADALRREGAAALVAVGPSLPADAHALAWAINAHLGAVGQTVVPVPARPVPGLGALMADMHKGAVDTLLVIDANPVYDAPALLRFADAMHRVPLSMHMGLYRDETARACTWHIPRAHELETWSDAMAWDGTPTILQPVIAPLHDGHSPHTLLQLLLDGAEHRAYELVQETWRAAWKDDFDARWAAALRSGYVEKPPPSPSTTSTSATMPNSEENDHQADHRLIAQVIPDPYLGAGAAANNAWLQELPRPLTRLTWDNAAFMGPATARAHAVATGDIVRLKAAHGGEVEAPVHVLPGHAERLVSLHLGYGRRHAGHVGDGVGFDAYAVQDCDDAGNPRRTVAVALERTSGQHRFAHVQTELSTHGRDIVRVENLQTAAAATEAAPAAAHAIEKTRTRQAQHSQPSLYPEVRYPDYAWAMTIDLDKCIGCNACTAACQVENNIPVVGAEEVRRGRAMHWIRVDVYHEKRETLVQPVPCMHCENAPCELVCPVGATVHDSEGLNAQVYNRCVGTRFCSNNCPYKVRRFNFLQYSDRSEDSAAHQNPDVTVRQRGVMEKCTYCVQRISRARIRAQEENRTLRDGEVVTACQAVCPTQAIVFGDLNDPASGVNATRASPRAYALLEELNTNPRTRYLARQADPDGRLESDDG
jgi:molybdopterin-containing oxidoreductase family iron-sulfur binding subunit